MKTMIFAAVSAIALGAAGVSPASAKWECIGPLVACGGASATAKKVTYGGERVSKPRKYASTTKTRRERVASKRYGGSGSSSGSYGGGMGGMASYYWQGTRTASGQRFNPSGMTAAHRSLPFGTKVLVTASNGRSVMVTINDRGPFVKGRVIDLSRGAAQQLGMIGAGVARVSLSVQ